MAAATTTTHGYGPNDGRTSGSSPRFKGRDHTKNTLCRNITIYGYCRHEKDGCLYNHNTSKLQNAAQADGNAPRRNLNVDSPSFTPVAPVRNGNANGTGAGNMNAKKAFSPKAAVAASFVPRNTKQALASPPSTHRSSSSQRSSNWSSHEVPEFVPHNFNPQHAPDLHPPSSLADPFHPYADAVAYTGLDSTPPNQSANLYAAEASSASAVPFFQQGNHLAPLQHHLYAPIGPYRENLLAYQRTAHDFFISEELRQELQRKSDATLQVLINSTLPPTVEHFHTLVPLDTNSQRNNQSFGYKTWVYKAVSSKDGYTYVLRRLEGFRLTSEKNVQSIQVWKQIRNASLVTIHDCFTTRAFGDSSLVIVTDHHPLAKTLVETQYQPLAVNRSRAFGSYAREEDLWGYIVQIASALRVIHAKGLAARLVAPSKVLVTSKGRVRLNGCAILDIVQAEEHKTMDQLQLEDMQQLGRMILSLATNNFNLNSNTAAKSLATISGAYSVPLKNCLHSLIENPPLIDTFLSEIASQVTDVMDKALHYEDDLTSNLARELENGRLVRLMTKLGFINERPEHTSHGNTSTHETMRWSETGERYYLKLFRDYVFHQVSQEGRPVLDLGHVITCLNKLDAGREEKIALITRDEQNVFVVSYKELKRGLDNAFSELIKVQQRT